MYINKNFAKKINVKSINKKEMVLLMNTKTYRKLWSIRIYLKSIGNTIKRINRLMNLRFSHSIKNPNKLVKKCVRIDEAIFQALRRKVGFNEGCISKTVSKAVLGKIESRVIDVIETNNFNHRITVRFTQDQYKLVTETIDELRKQGIKNITFSLLVRSILYEYFRIVTEIETEVNSNVA